MYATESWQIYSIRQVSETFLAVNGPVINETQEEIWLVVTFM